ncbi:MAG TPA: 50S ribosomal protein L21 [Nitrospiria bacterium]
MYAIVETGGKQYKMSEGETHRLELLEGNAGDTVDLNKVLLIQTEKNVQIGRPFLENTSVVAEILGQRRGDKVLIFKKKRRKGYQRTQGHRQSETWVKIQEIKTEG